MADTSPTKARKGDARPGANMRLVEALAYKLPLAAKLSILHRASGIIMAVLLPFVIWLFDKSVSSEASYDEFASAFTAGIGVIPGFIVKLATLGLIWAFLHHACAGARHLWMDATHSVTKQQGASSAKAVFAVSIALTIALGAKLFGLF